jgi:hypothetical protein
LLTRTPRWREAITLSWRKLQIFLRGSQAGATNDLTMLMFARELVGEGSDRDAAPHSRHPLARSRKSAARACAATLLQLLDHAFERFVPTAASIESAAFELVAALACDCEVIGIIAATEATRDNVLEGGMRWLTPVEWDADAGLAVDAFADQIITASCAYLLESVVALSCDAQ